MVRIKIILILHFSNSSESIYWILLMLVKANVNLLNIYWIKISYYSVFTVDLVWLPSRGPILIWSWGMQYICKTQASYQCLLTTWQRSNWVFLWLMLLSFNDSKLQLKSRKYNQFSNKCDSRVVIYDRRVSYKIDHGPSNDNYLQQDKRIFVNF